MVSKYNRDFDEDIAWKRFASCNRLPDPGDDSQIMDYIRSIGDEKVNSFDSIFKLCEKNDAILQEVSFKENRAQEKQDEQEEKKEKQDEGPLSVRFDYFEMFLNAFRVF